MISAPRHQQRHCTESGSVQQQKHSQLAAIASQMTFHMLNKASSLANTTPQPSFYPNYTPPSSPRQGILGHPIKERSTKSIRYFPYHPHMEYDRPYSATAGAERTNSTFGGITAQCNFLTNNAGIANSLYSCHNTPYLVQDQLSPPSDVFTRQLQHSQFQSSQLSVHQPYVQPSSSIFGISKPISSSPSNGRRPSPQAESQESAFQFFQVTSETQQIQKIVMTSLLTLRLPSHTIILALYFVHRLLTSALLFSTSTSSAGQSESLFPSILSNPTQTDFGANPVSLFLAGLMLADSVLCDAPVSTATWSWIFTQASSYSSASQANSATGNRNRNPSPGSQYGKHYVRDLKRWALDVLGFDVNVSAAVYSDWFSGVKVFLEKQGEFQQKMLNFYSQSLVCNTQPVVTVGGGISGVGLGFHIGPSAVFGVY